MEQARTLKNLLFQNNYLIILRRQGGPFIRYSLKDDGSLFMERLMFNHNVNKAPKKLAFSVTRSIVTAEGDLFDPFYDIPDHELLQPEDSVVYDQVSPKSYVMLRAHNLNLPVLFLRTLIRNSS